MSVATQDQGLGDDCSTYRDPFVKGRDPESKGRGGYRRLTSPKDSRHPDSYPLGHLVGVTTADRSRKEGRYNGQ